MTPDVLVLGGGVIGLSAVHECARRGAVVALVSDGRPGATMAAAGMLCPAFEALQTGGRSMAAMGRSSLALWDEFADRIGGGDPARTIGYERLGTIGVGYPPGSLPGMKSALPNGIEAGSCVLVEGEGQVDPRLLLPTLDAACRELGVRMIHERAVGRTEDGAVLADGSVLRAGRTVLAAGVTDLLPRVELTAVRGRAFLVTNVIGLDRVVRSPSVYFAPKGDGLLYVGATEEEAGLSRDGGAALDGLWSEACWLAPKLADATVVGRFDGLRPRLPDELPMIGIAPDDDRLVLAIGHHRNGVLLAPLTAARVAELALEGGSYVDEPSVATLRR